MEVSKSEHFLVAETNCLAGGNESCNVGRAEYTIFRDIHARYIGRLGRKEVIDEAT